MTEVELTDEQQKQYIALNGERALRERADGLQLHQGENRRMRRAGVATFTPHADLPEGPGLRRRLVKQRQRLGTLDPELRRLQKAKLRAKGIR
jgi:hypothetical protein